MKSITVQKLSNYQSMAIAFLVAGGFFMENIDATMIVTAMPAMGRSCSVQASDLSLAVLIPISGWVADVLGARKVFATAVVVFTVASVLCGSSHGLYWFVAARILQGAGGSMMVPVGRLVVLNNTPKEKLINAIAALTWPALIAPVLGPLLGGLITVHFGWRWIFWVNVPIGIIAMVAALILIPTDIGGNKKTFDWIGFILTGAAIVCLVYGTDLASLQTVEWVRVIGLLLACLVLLAVAVRYLNQSKNPMVTLSSLRVKTFAVTMCGGSLFRMSIFAVPFLLPLMLQVGFGLSAVYSGIILMALFAGNCAMKPATTPIMRRFGFKPVILVCGTINGLLVLACAFITPTMPTIAIMIVVFAGGMARSMQFTCFNTIAFADIGKNEMSSANTLFSTINQLSMGLGVVLGALSIRLASGVVNLVHSSALAAIPGIEYRLAFVPVAIVTLLGIVDGFTLAPDAGDAVSKKRK